MGRKSRIARGLDISAAARKMLEKATGMELTDEECSALEREALKSPMERDLEEFEEIMLNELEASLSPPILEEVVLPPIYYRLERERVWWLPYVTPRPTWAIYHPESYAKALGWLYKRPPPPELEEGITLGICTGLTIGEGYFSYGIGRERRFPRIVIKMMEEEPVEDFARKVGTKHYLIERYKEVFDVWGGAVYGLRCVLLSTLMYPYITGKRKSMCKYFYEKGYTVTLSEAIEFAKRFRARRTIIRTPKEEAGSEIIEEEVVEVEPEPRP